ncbi:MAG: GGDEF domain-containing protein [Clostridium sp.]|uniref:GGDEF domain-containing protein n=1 Tax=Clostridium sp. TaxID=1506 RepID=UPI003F375401
MYEKIRFDGRQTKRKLVFLLILMLLAVITYFYKFNIYNTIFSLASIFIILILEFYGIVYAFSTIIIIAVTAMINGDTRLYYITYILDILFIWGLGKVLNGKIKVTMRSIIYALTMYSIYLIIYETDALSELQIIDRLSNTILDALIADLLLFYTPLSKVFNERRESKVVLKEAIFYILAVLVIIPLTLNFILLGRNNSREVESYHKIIMELPNENIKNYMNDILAERLIQTKIVIIITAILAVCACFAGKKLILEIERLVYVISDASKETENKKNIKWPESNINEITVLTGNFEMLLFKFKVMLNKTMERNKELHKQAITDELTSIENRLSFNKYIKEEIDLSNEKVAIALLDIDKFKNINDTLGHEAGDYVLIEVANRLKRLSYKGIRVFRTGGDEFLLIKILKDGNNLNIYGEEIIELFKSPISIYNKIYCITTSVGISKFDADVSDVSNIIKEADIAMYEAKKESGSSYKIFKNNAKNTGNK